MASHNGPIVMRKDPDFPGVDIRDCRVIIPKCSTVLAQEHCEGEQSIIDSKSEGDQDFPAVEETDLSVNIRKYIRKCTTVSPEEQVQDEQSTVSAEENSEDEQSIANSIMESVNLILPVPLNCPLPPDTDTEVVAEMERFGKLKLTDPVAQTDEVSDNNYQF